MKLDTVEDARALLLRAWPQMVQECREVLGGELFYQNVIYHALRQAGAPLKQTGMNVRQFIKDPASDLFKLFMNKRHEDYRGGFESIPDVVIFTDEVNGDWRRRSGQHSLSKMLMAIEVKASERASSRLSRAEITLDIRKLAAHRDEVIAFGLTAFEPVMMIIDVAPSEQERMKPEHIATCKRLAQELTVDWFYVSRETTNVWMRTLSGEFAFEGPVLSE